MLRFIIFSFGLVAGPGFAAADPGCYSSALLRAQTARVYALTRLSSRGMTGISAESLPRKPAQRGGDFAMVSPFRDPRARDVIR